MTKELNMQITLIEKNGKKYMEGRAGALLLVKEQDALDIIGNCGYNDTNNLLLHPENVHEDFFNLKSGLAGAVLQKFVNYQMRLAAYFTEQQMEHIRFQELVKETNRSSHFRVFSNKQDAEDWLLSSY